MRKTVACSAPYDQGGLGQHFSLIVEEARTANRLIKYYSPQPKATDPTGRAVQVPQHFQWLMRYTPLRFNSGWLHYCFNDWFDRAVASVMISADEFETACAGQAFHSFNRARQLGYGVLALQADNSHANNVIIQHLKATQRFGIESSWLNEAQRRKMLWAYERADVIYIASDYTRRSFAEAGVPESKLRSRSFTPDPRFVPPLQCVYVHRSFEDGFAYAPIEGMACGVLAIVTQDTGMKDHIQEGVNGYVVPTGNWQALLDQLLMLQQSIAPSRRAAFDRPCSPNLQSV